MKIPSYVKVGLKKYKVTKTDKIKYRFSRGYCDYENREIVLATHSGYNGDRYSKKDMSHTFWHECVHAILEDMGSRLYRDEKFVDGIALRINKLIESAKFDE